MYSLKKLVREIMEKIGSVTMGTSATTITGAIAEHETDISNLYSKFIIGNPSKVLTSGSLNAFTGLAVTDFAITPPSGYHLFANVYCRINGVTGVSAFFDGHQNDTVFSTSPQIYIFNNTSASKNLANGVIRVTSIYEKD